MREFPDKYGYATALANNRSSHDRGNCLNWHSFFTLPVLFHLKM